MEVSDTISEVTPVGAPGTERKQSVGQKTQYDVRHTV